MKESHDIAVKLDGDGFLLKLIGFELKGGGVSFHDQGEMADAWGDGDYWVVLDDRRTKPVYVPDDLMADARALMKEGGQ